jgi:hypothetical protein
MILDIRILFEKIIKMNNNKNDFYYYYKNFYLFNYNILNIFFSKNSQYLHIQTQIRVKIFLFNFF